MVKIISGSNNDQYSIEELGTNPTIANVRMTFADMYNIKPDAKVFVSNPLKQVATAEVKEDYIIRDGDEVEFILAAGNKG